MNLTVKKVAP